MFVLRDLEGEDTCQTGKFTKCPGENPTITMNNGEKTITGARSTVVGGGKKSKKNNKRKKKFRSKKNKK